VIDFQVLQEEEVDTENEDMTTGGLEDIIPHNILNTGVTPTTNKLLMVTIPEVILLEAEAVQGVVLDLMKNTFVTQDMPTSNLMVGMDLLSSIIHEATRIEITILSTQEVNQVTVITTDV
jgi:hypothetical protein